MLTQITICAGKITFGSNESEKDDVPLARGSYEERTAYSYEETETSTKEANLANGNTLEVKKLEPKIKTKPPFNKKADKNGNFDEFDKQLGDQQDAINKMTVKEWLDNRDFFKNNKSDYDKLSKKEKEKFRRKEIRKKTKVNVSKGIKPRDLARQQAIESMDGQAALHNPDGIAGGKADAVTRMGDSSINSSIGSQWRGKGRADSIEQQVREQLLQRGVKTPPNSNVPKDIMMNVNLLN